MADKQKLNDMLDAMVNDETEKAEIAFHSYLKDKMQDVLKGQQEEPAPAETQDKKKGE